MDTKIIEAEHHFNWGKFMLGRFTPSEWAYRSTVDNRGLLKGRGWARDHTLVLDLQTGEGAIFALDGLARADLNDKHRIWVCPMYEPFLEWLYEQDTENLHALPDRVELPAAPGSMFGYRREGRPSLPWHTTYDPEANAGYIYVGEPRGTDGTTEKVHDGVLLDLRADGTLAGIEIIGPQSS